MLLSINIPTYERLESFTQVLLELECEIKELNREYQRKIEINVYENNSSVKLQKDFICKNIKERSNININYSINETNIGGDENILQCCIASPNSTFTWVLGDDDHIVEGSLSKILYFLKSHENDLGLLLLRDQTPSQDSSVIDKRFDSYFIFANTAVYIRPHILLEHSLISANIFRTSLFDASESAYVTRDLTKRIGLSGNFSHMRGMVKGLLSNKGSSYCVITPNFISLNTSIRFKTDDKTHSEMNKIYYFYYQWLLSEIGIRGDRIKWTNLDDNF